MKQCSKCRMEKCETEFYSRASAKDGLRSNCKSCMMESLDKQNKLKYDAVRYEKKKEEIDRRAIDYYHKNKDKKKKYDKDRLALVMEQRRERYRTDLTN